MVGQAEGPAGPPSGQSSISHDGPPAHGQAQLQARRPPAGQAIPPGGAALLRQLQPAHQRAPAHVRARRAGAAAGARAAPAPQLPHACIPHWCTAVLVPVWVAWSSIHQPRGPVHSVDAQEGYDVLGAYMSPVHDAYAKKGLAPVAHRIAMCQLAAQTSPLIMVRPAPCLRPCMLAHTTLGRLR